MASAKHPQSRARRYARRAVIGVAVLLGLVALTVTGALLSLRVASVRSYIVSRVNGVLADSFKGRVLLHRVGTIGLTGVSAADAEVFDPVGHRVLDIHGLSAQLSVPSLVWAVLTHKSQPLAIRLETVSIRHAEVALLDNGSGSPTLADTFLPKTPSPPSSGPGTIVVIARAAFDHVWAHGTVAGSPPLDVELKDTVGALRLDAQKTALELKQTALLARGLPAGVDPKGQLQGSLDIPAAASQPLAARAHYQGDAAGIPIVLDASYLDLKLAATLQARDIPPAAVAKQIPGLQLRSPAMLSASAEGKLPELRGTFALGVGSGQIDGDFELFLQSDLRAKTNVRMHGLDLAELARSAPASSLDLTLHAAVLAPQSGPVSGHFDIASQPSVLAAQPLPGISLSGTFASDAKAQRNRVEAHAEIAEPGAQTGVDATLVQAKRTSIEFRSTTKLRSPPRLKRLATVTSVQGDLTAQGSYEIEAQRLNAQVHAALQGIQQGANRCALAKLDASITGGLPHPEANVRLDLSDATLAGQQVTEAQIAARGSLSRLALSGEVVTKSPERHVQLSALVSNNHGIVVDHPSVNLRQGATNLRVSADGLSVDGGRTRLSGLRLEGAGKADVSLVYGSALESIHVQTYDLDLARLWRLVEPNAALKSGTATISASYEQRAGSPRVRLTARSQDLAFDRISGGSLNADLNLEQGRLDGSVNADLKQLGQLNADFEELRGVDVTHPDPNRITGKLGIAGQVRLKDLTELVPKDIELPIARALGTIKYDVAIEREHAGSGLPTFHVHVSSNKLQLAGARDSKTTLTTKQEARAAAPLAIKGIDVILDLEHAESGETALAASVSDARGKLVALSVEGKATPRIATVVSELSSQWRQLPLSVKLSVPPRELEQLPVEVRPVGLSGLVSADFSYDGTLSAPDFKLSGKVEKFRQTEDSRGGIDLAWQGSYSQARGKFSALARAGTRDVAKAELDVATAFDAWLNQASGTPPLDANAHLNFDAFPIGLIPTARTGQLEGALSGSIALEHFGKNATVDVKLDSRALKLASTDLGQIHAEVTARDGQANALLRVESRGGTTTAEGHSGLDWGARFVPAVRLPADAQLHAKELRLAAFAPLVTSLFGELDGRLNGDLNAHFRGGAPELDGHVDLKDGAVQLAAVGQRFDQLTARVSLEPGKAKLEELTARATSGKLKVTGEARFSGLDLTGADAQVRIAKNQKLSLSVAGTEIGELWGGVDLKVRPGAAKGSQSLAVEIPELHVRLPDTGSQDLQDLDPAKGVRIGTHQRAGDFVTLALQPLKEGDASKNQDPMLVDLHLGDQIFIQQGDTTKIQLGGDLKLVLGDPLTMTGQINLRGGQLDVSGKQFEVESGAVTFSGEPSNPTIVATARWDAQDEDHHRVYADASGSASALKVNLRSEPPLTKDQVLSLIVTGTADGSIGGSGSGGGGTAATAVGAVGGAATQGINKALSSISDLDVSTRVDTSTGSARPELVIRVSPKVSAQITRALGEPAPGQPPDLTFLTLNFRVLRNWSLSALVGDRGESGLDLVWRKRY